MVRYVLGELVMHEGETRCVDCSAPSDTPYCANCGQPLTERLTFPGLVRGALAHLTDLDAGLVYTFRQLTVRPGPAIAEYLRGRPRRFTSPVKYAFVAASALGLAGLFVSNAPGGTAEADLLDTTQRFSGLWAFSIFIAALGVAAFQRLLFASDDRNVAELYAFQLFVMGHLTWLMLVWVALNTVTPIRSLESGVRLLEVGFMVWALRGFVVVHPLRLFASGAFLWFVWKILTLAVLLGSARIMGP